MAARGRCKRNAICAAVLIGHRVTSSRISSSVQRDMAGLYTGGVARLSLSLIRCTSMVVQAFSASASVLKGEPPTFMAVRF